MQTGATTVSDSVELIKGQRDRHAEEAIAAAIVLNLVAEFKGLSTRADLCLGPAENLVVDRCDAPLDWQRLLNGEMRIVAGNTAAASHAVSAAGSARLIFPGAFHPRHDGHLQMARLASDRLGLPVEHELSIVNVDKPPIDFIEMRERVSQFEPDEPFWLTRAATFVEKAALFPHATFIVGADTIVRIADPKYYASESARDDALVALAAVGCRFLVFSRWHNGEFHSLCDLALPDALNKICDEVSAEEFRVDISSTALRASGKVARS